MDDSNTHPPRTELRPVDGYRGYADNNPKRPQRDKLADACDLYEEARGRRPNFLLTSALDAAQCRKEGTYRDLGLIAVESSSSILPFIYYVGEIETP